MGMNAAFNLEEIEVQLPSANDLAAIDCAEFMDSTIFIAHIHLYDFREGVLSSTVSMQDLKSRNIHVTLMRPLNILSNWRKLLPEHINFEFSQGVPPAMIAMPEMRSLASVYLRFHHVSTTCTYLKSNHVCCADTYLSAMSFCYGQSC